MKKLDLQEKLIEACRRGDRKAQSQLYNQYSRAMYNICLRMLRNEADAEDTLQISFVDIFRNLEKFRFQSTPGAWIKRIVINNCINFLRKKRIRFEDMDSVQIADESPIDDATTEHEYNVQTVQECMSQLSDGYRTVFTLYLIEGYDHKEIAQILEISEATSKSQFHRAKMKMRMLLKAAG